jgi:hypothetical protein
MPRGRALAKAECGTQAGFSDMVMRARAPDRRARLHIGEAAGLFPSVVAA